MKNEFLISQLKEKKDEINKLENQFKVTHSQLNEKINRIIELKIKLEEKTEEISKLKERLNQEWKIPRYSEFLKKIYHCFE